MKILVTGGAGFIGSNLVHLAVARGHRVINLDKLTYAACPGNHRELAEGPLYCLEQADICDGAAVSRILADHCPDAVINLAAETHVDRSIDSPAAFIRTNITGTFVLLEAVRTWWTGLGRPSGFRFCHVSTDEVYGSLGPEGRFTETSPHAPNSPYAASKAAADHLVRAWGNTWGLPVLVTNCSNNYGPFQFPEKLVPVVILGALARRTIPVYGRGDNRRDWLYAGDHARALLLVLERGTPGSSWVIGGESECTNLDLVHRICTILDRLRPGAAPASTLIRLVEDRPGHDARYAIDPARIRRELDWRPSVSLNEGLELTVRWYLAHGDWWRALLDRPGVGRRLGLGADAVQAEEGQP